jgi:phosphate acetyltransferase
MALSSTAREAVAQPQVKYERLIAKAKKVVPATTLVVHPCDETSLRGAVEAAKAGLIVPILVGPTAKISALADKYKLDIGGIELSTCRIQAAAAGRQVFITSRAN